MFQWHRVRPFAAWRLGLFVVSTHLVLGLQSPNSGRAGTIAQWDFNGGLTSSSGGPAAVPAAALPAATPSVSFTSSVIGGQPAQSATFSRGTYFRLAHGLGANGGGVRLNRYSVILDVLFSSRPTGWAALVQTSPDNADDADWFINPTGGLGISSNYGGNVPDGSWSRISLVIDSAAGTFTSYRNGIQVQQLTGVTVDGRFSLDSSLLIFADENQENAGGQVNSVQIRSEPMLPAEVASLGAANSAGIPLPAPSTLTLLQPNGGELFQAGSTQTVRWSSDFPRGTVQLDLYHGTNFSRSLGQAPMAQGQFSWAISSRLGDAADYRVRIFAVSAPAVADTSDSPFAVAGSSSPPSPFFGQALQANGDFEAQLAGWTITAGAPLTLSSAAGRGAPHGGSLFLHGGLNSPGDTRLSQEIDLLARGFTAGDIDRGAVAESEAWLRNQYGAGVFDDQVYFRMSYLDGARGVLAHDRTMVAANSVWVPQRLSGLLPAGTRHLRVEVVGQHRRDANNDSMADDIVVRLQDAPNEFSPQITKLPMLQDVRPDAMKLLWETDGNLCHHAVEWGRSNVSEQVVTEVETLQIDTTHFVHRATLPGLAVETSYVYRVRSGATVTPAYSFRTPPRRATPFAVAWWGDNHQGTGILRTHVANFLAQGVNLIAVAGDMVNSGNLASEWHDYWFKPLEHLNCAQTIPVVFARGNHDGEHALAYAYSALPGNEAWYAFDYGNSRFIFLDSETDTTSSPEQYQWLQAELARPETRRAAFRIVCFHRPPFVNLWNGGGYTGEQFVRNDWTPLLAAGNVDVVISGHAHNYNRGVTNGVTYIISGGGGGTLDVERVANWGLFTVEYSRYHYGLMEVNGGTMLWQAFDDANQLIDLVTLKSRTPELSLQPAAPSQIRAILSGRPGSTYVLERSTALTGWSSLVTNTLATAGTGEITNTLPAAGESQFFRARLR